MTAGRRGGGRSASNCASKPGNADWRGIPGVARPASPHRSAPVYRQLLPRRWPSRVARFRPARPQIGLCSTWRSKWPPLSQGDHRRIIPGGTCRLAGRGYKPSTTGGSKTCPHPQGPTTGQRTFSILTRIDGSKTVPQPVPGDRRCAFSVSSLGSTARKPHLRFVFGCPNIRVSVSSLRVGHNIRLVPG